ncbi:SRPBCC family protein [Halostagnicola sp. A-GB9-2]|uniref:SRPBCC family protein n=1 Tax=Halostagnicola sp. A-GB9-2 TaxID=3048066 RepID=UPI0024C04766|nr:SRPBCC family protein [Halostagnicola sp. A-GB9-2]MDJ1434155.1 SRPBCC family protein [Halostagnicola sp. A-GB9-2]
MSLKAAFETGEDGAMIGAATEPPQWRRIASAAIGGGLVLFGLKNRSVTGSIAAIAGGWLVYRGVTGRDRPEPKYDADAETDMEIGHDAGSGTDSEAQADSQPGISSEMLPRSSVDTSAIVDRIRSEIDTNTPRIERSITIGASPEELYELWSEPDTLEQIVGPGGKIETVDADEGRWRWTIPGPLEQAVAWETELVDEEPGEYIRWETLEGERLSSDGSVEFQQAPADRGTEVTLQLEFHPPGGPFGNAVMNGIDIVPGTLAEKTLNRFKSLAETGEIPSLETNPSGRGTGDLM